MTELAERRTRLMTRIAETAAGRPVQLLAVSKQQDAVSIRALVTCGQRAFGENYVQEALAKMRELALPEIEWHLIGPLQSNKCREVAEHFDWVQSVDREKLVPLLARYRPAGRIALNVLIQVNIDQEDSKSGCPPEHVAALATAIAACPSLCLRGLMAIPAPLAELAARRSAFQRMRVLFEQLKASHPQVDTLSMGMSDDYLLAIEEGANLVRIGSALFGRRGPSA
jgi:pyridoxal phosphate enzyme (YggS family)